MLPFSTKYSSAMGVVFIHKDSELYPFIFRFLNMASWLLLVFLLLVTKKNNCLVREFFPPMTSMCFQLLLIQKSIRLRISL